MKRYELMFVINPSQEEGIDDVKKRIEGIITGREGTVVSFDKLGKKRLSYPIAKQLYGIYFLVNFKGDGRIVQALDYFLRLNPSVLRHIILSFTDKQLQLKELTERIQQEEVERMRRGGRPLETPKEKKPVPDVKEAELPAVIQGEEAPEVEPTPSITEDIKPESVETVEVIAETAPPAESEPSEAKPAATGHAVEGEPAEVQSANQQTQPVEDEPVDEKSETVNIDESNEKTVE